jgi:hypothetical protein
MILAHRRRDDERAGAIDVGGVMRLDIDAEPAEVVARGRICVTTRDARTTAHQKLGESAHTSAGDTDKVDGSRVVRIQKGHQRGI